MIAVRCPEKGEWINESKVDVIDIEEDFQGRDILTFVCPLCNQEHTSLRVGRSYV